MIDQATLIERAKNKASIEGPDYWEKVVGFLNSLEGTSLAYRKTMTSGKWNWLAGIKAELWEPGD